MHRGIFHSLPVALIFCEIAFLVCTAGDLNLRYFKAGAIAIGFMSHLILDEIWSIDFRHHASEEFVRHGDEDVERMPLGHGRWPTRS